MMCHLAMLEETPDGASTTWLEPVTDQEYAAAHQGPVEYTPGSRQVARATMFLAVRSGDFSPPTRTV